MNEKVADMQLRRDAKRIGLHAIKRRAIYRLRDRDGKEVHAGDLDATNAFLAARLTDHRWGPALAPAWAEAIDAYLLTLSAAGQRPATCRLRRQHLNHMARGLNCAPSEMTAETLVGWFGRQIHWKPETRRGYRSAACGFFSWAYRSGRIAVYLGDVLPRARQPKATPRPASDHAWRTALMAADPRLTVMLRLAAEAGLRRAEVAAVATGDVLPGVDGAQLLVHGKGGKQRVVPISDSLAELLRQGAAGHTPGAPAVGWLFPNGHGGHLAPETVGGLVTEILPDGYTMHTLRHRFATRAYRGTRNLRAVQVLLGHESIATTERYTATDDSEIRAAMVAAGTEMSQ